MNDRAEDEAARSTRRWKLALRGVIALWTGTIAVLFVPMIVGNWLIRWRDDVDPDDYADVLLYSLSPDLVRLGAASTESLSWTVIREPHDAHPWFGPRVPHVFALVGRDAAMRTTLCTIVVAAPLPDEFLVEHVAPVRHGPSKTIEVLDGLESFELTDDELVGVRRFLAHTECGRAPSE